MVSAKAVDALRGTAKALGVSFERGVAKTAGGKKFTGVINNIRKSDLANMEMHYVDGAIQKVLRNGKPYKLYSYQPEVKAVLTFPRENSGFATLSRITNWSEGSYKYFGSSREMFHLPFGYRVNPQLSNHQTMLDVKALGDSLSRRTTTIQRVGDHGTLTQWQKNGKGMGEYNRVQDITIA